MEKIINSDRKELISPVKLKDCDNLGDTFIEFKNMTPIEQWERIDNMLEEEGLQVIRITPEPQTTE